MPGIRTLRLRGSDLLVTYGELNASPDYLSSGRQADTAPKEVMLPILQFVRQETHIQFAKLLGHGGTTEPFKDAVYSAARFLPDMLDLPRGEHGDRHADQPSRRRRDRPLRRPAGAQRLPLRAVRLAPLAGLATRPRGCSPAGARGGQYRRRAQLTHDAWIQHGYADHFLQDSFAAGHLVNKTLVMQWFVEWAAGKSLIPVAEWHAVQNMVPNLQPGIAGRHLYDPDYAGISNDPQTSEDQTELCGQDGQRPAWWPGASTTLDDAYQDYFYFLSSLIAQSASGAIHDHYNKHSLSVASVAQPQPYAVYGDHTLLSGAQRLRRRGGHQLRGEAVPAEPWPTS